MCRSLLLQVQGQLAVLIKGNGSDASVPESDVKRIRVWLSIYINEMADSPLLLSSQNCQPSFSEAGNAITDMLMVS